MAGLVLFGEALIDAFPQEDVLGGAPFNVARTMAAFGRAPHLISCIGLDEGANVLRAELRRFHLDESGVQVDPFHPTGRVAVELSLDGHRFDILANQAYDHIDLAKAAASIAAAFQNTEPSVFYFGTMAQRAEISRHCLDALLESTSALKYLDLNLREGQHTPAIVSASLKRADMVKVNEEELRFLLETYVVPGGVFDISFGDAAARSRLLPALQSLLDQFTLQSMVMTLGARGYAYLDNKGRLLFDDAPDVGTHVIDTVGCGDAFSAVLITGILSDWPIELSLQRARRFATAMCGVRGSAATDKEFYSRWMQLWAAEDLA